MANISFNPVQVTNAAGAFRVSSTGGVQGTLADDPVVLAGKLRSGILSPSATSPIWGGIGVTVSLPTAGTEANEVGAVLTAASAYSNLIGFTVYNQSTATVQTPNSTAPVAAAGMSINFVELGSGARFWVKSASGLAASLEGGAINQQVSWDFTNQQLITFSTTALACNVVGVNVGGSQIVSYNSGTGYATWSYGQDAVLIEI